ncbi:MAG TPA: PD-(D/E)XK nuclease family protein [Haliscomenobacter sp.]|uniref:PDDEXK-like family protein n=1 Tax=Haliscomenobacter sp. TaxID=2717303 RepID=UPI002C10DB0F|nr:PD-(D/E)XK nuclease family protein [Haliscomenobacter sp.]HOY16690.1 PD-(D/E)XK nuclease family protein [Haliscomenobacter sp.]
MENQHEIGQILNEVQTISDSYERVAEVTGENFNIFSILQMESDEVATHSRFIAELLNRKGRHGQKDKFLCNFIKLFAVDSNINTAKSQVTVEYHIGKVEIEKGGRIDILIKDDEDNVIMIENKIYAGEQYNQLLRYYNAFPKGKLLYLTLFGDDSSQESSKGIYNNISYENDIITWLEECKKDAVNVPILRETISQYINLLKKLTHQNLNKKMNQDIISRILKDKKSLTAYKTLFDLSKDLKKEIIKDITQKIRIMLERKGFINIETMDIDKDRGRLAQFETPTLNANKLRFVLNFESNNYSNLILGFVNVEPNQAQDSRLLELIKNEFPKAKQSAWWNFYMLYEEYRDWSFTGLSEIYFDNDETFYKDLENKIDRMLAIFESRVEL